MRFLAPDPGVLPSAEGQFRIVAQTLCQCQPGIGGCWQSQLCHLLALHALCRLLSSGLFLLLWLVCKALTITWRGSGAWHSMTLNPVMRKLVPFPWSPPGSLRERSSEGSYAL